MQLLLSTKTTLKFLKKFISDVYEVVIKNKVQEMALLTMQVLILITESKMIISWNEVK